MKLDVLQRAATMAIKADGDFDTGVVTFTYAGKAFHCSSLAQAEEFVAFAEALVEGWK